MTMKAYILLGLALSGAVATAQMPASNNGGGNNGGTVSVPSSFDASGSGAKPPTDDPARRGEAPNPQLLGMEIPLLDPSTDTVAYNGGYFDVGNNAMVRARFEKYLHQLPDDSDESKRYRKLINDILKETEKSGKDSRYIIGSGTLVRIGHNLYAADKYPGDGGQSGDLANSMVVVLDAQRQMLKREKENEKLDAELKGLLKEANSWQNQNELRAEANSRTGQDGVGSGPSKNKNGGSSSSKSAATNTLKITHHVESMAENKAQKTANKAANEAALAAAKINYQSMLVSMLLSRRFDHVVIGSRVYRHLFKDGDTKLNLKKESKANDLFSKGAGMPPTVNVMGSFASNARREVDQNIQAVFGLLAQNKLGEATQHLIEAVAVGEYMQSVATFPAEGRQRIAAYWTLRKQALVALNARDYAKVEEIAKKMSELDVDFNDSMLRSYVAAKKKQSDFAIRNAKKAMLAGNEEEFRKYIEEATIVWPLNPNLDVAADKLTEMDEGDPIKEEFATLYKEGNFRTIAKREERYQIVALDPELAKQYKESIALVMKMDGMIEQLNAVAEQDVRLGPCAAYEKMLECQSEDPRYAADEKMRDALHTYESHAHDFVEALRGAERSCKKREYGSALSAYYRAQCIYPQSKIAKDGIRNVLNIIVQADYQ